MELAGEFKRVNATVDFALEVTEQCYRSRQAKGLALLFENPKDSNISIVGNLYGTGKRVAMALVLNEVKYLRTIGETLAFLKIPTLPTYFSDA